MGRFELPAPRPPDEYSNLAELHPEEGVGVSVLRSVSVVDGGVFVCVAYEAIWDCKCNTFLQPNKKGYPIKIRIIQNRKSSYINLKYYIPVNQKSTMWNSEKNELRRSYKYYDEVQKLYKRYLNEFQFEHFKAVSKGETCYFFNSLIISLAFCELGSSSRAFS